MKPAGPADKPADDRDRVLGPDCPDLAAYERTGGGAGLEAALRLGGPAVIDEVEASGLRGRGGAGFPTATKWRTVLAHGSAAVPTTVVVNAAEGEPGSFKDRAILRTNPYRVIEGALIAATALDADRVIVATKASFTTEIERLRTAVAQIEAAAWVDGVSIEVFGGPGEYLYGEETALLEVLAGRAPFPRIAPPFRHGVDEIGDGTTSTAGVSFAGPTASTPAPPTLVNNTETLANLPRLLAEGSDWFRSVGTAESPGTMVFTVTGSTKRHGVAELPLGLPLREVIETIGSGAERGQHLTAVLSGVSHPFLPASALDTLASFEALEHAGAGLGAGGFIVFDDSDDLVAAAAGVARFLAVESCGQCTPCKQDGLAIAELLARLCTGNAEELDLVAVADRARSVTDEARCFLAHQQQRVVESVLRLFPDAFRLRLSDADPAAVDPLLIAPIADIVDGVAVIDESQAAKHPDWTTGGTYSGQSPADRIDQGSPLSPRR